MRVIIYEATKINYLCLSLFLSFSKNLFNFLWTMTLTIDNSIFLIKNVFNNSIKIKPFKTSPFVHIRHGM